MTFVASTISEHIAHEAEVRTEKRFRSQIQELEARAMEARARAAEAECASLLAKLGAEKAKQETEKARQALTTLEDLKHEGLISEAVFKDKAIPHWQVLAAS